MSNDAPAKITISVRRDGTILAETIGIKGPSCLSQIEVLEQMLEAETMTSSYTPEFYETLVPQDATSIEENYLGR